MSANGPLSGINFSGLASGVDSSSIIQKLMQIESIPLQRLQQNQTALQSKQGLFAAFRQQLVALQTATGSLTNASAFNPVAATSSDTTTATISTTTGASAGVYSLSVTRLAQAQKVSSAPQTDATSALGKSGTIVVNGKQVQITASDSLTAIAQKINSANSGATASVLNGGTGNAFLTIAANSSGVANKLDLADLSGTTLADLGVVSGAAAIRAPITNGASTLAFTSNTQTLESLTSFTTPATAHFTLNGTDVAVNMASATLDSLATTINAANTGATATVQSTTDSSGNTTYKLNIVGAAGTPTMVDTDGLLTTLGVLSQGATTELVKAQDASYTLDNVALTSSSNTITNVIPGATITLLRGSEGAPATAAPAASTISLTKDTTAINANVKNFVDAYNSVQSFISQNSQFDATSFQSGPLFGDPVADQVQSQLADMLFSPVPGLSGQYNSVASLGFTLDDKGVLSVDNAQLDAAVNGNPDAVDALFRARGTSGNPDIQFVSSTNATHASGAGAYDVNITQQATKGSYTAEMAQTTASTSLETLTFNGGLFANTAYGLTIPIGSTIDDTVTRVNSDSKLKDLVVASNVGGSLQIASKRYGSAGNFTVVSNITAGSDNSGIGVGSLGATVSGLDVAGTINGEAATGAGQFLTGNAGNATTDGLQIQYGGTATGLVGSIQFTKGIAAQTSDLMNSFTDSQNGLLSATDQSLTSELTDITQEITDQQALLALKQTSLQQKYSAMEQAISQLQSQQQRISSISSPSN